MSEDAFAEGRLRRRLGSVITAVLVLRLGDHVRVFILRGTRGSDRFVRVRVVNDDRLLLTENSVVAVRLRVYHEDRIQVSAEQVAHALDCERVLHLGRCEGFCVSCQFRLLYLT